MEDSGDGGHMLSFNHYAYERSLTGCTAIWSASCLTFISLVMATW